MSKRLATDVFLFSSLNTKD